MFIRKAGATFIAITCCVAAPSQTVVDAELAFAKTASDQSIRSAFLQHADSNAVVFQGGRILNAIATWKTAREGAGVLAWQPHISGVSGAGDLGFNAGPFTFQTSARDTVSANGMFATVWTKDPAGNWKFLVDLGVENSQPLKPLPALQYAGALVPAPGTTSIDPVELAFIRDYQLNGNHVYTGLLTARSWFNIDGMAPLTDSAAVIAAIDRIPAGVVYEPVKSGISASKDLAYVYGYATINGKKENYLRVWGHTMHGWKIMLSVLKR